MARMLQALKNLEARSVRLPAPKPATKKPEPVAVATTAPPQREKIVPPIAAASTLPIAQVWTAEPPIVAPEFAKLAITELEPASRIDTAPSSEPLAQPKSSTTSTSDFGYAVSFSLPSLNIPRQPEATLAEPTRPPSPLERSIRRTLRDPTRAKPLEELAERLQRDIVHNECKTLVFVGIGPAGATLETLLYAATLLAERERERVLLLDADPARQSLTTGLEYGHQRGLTELLANDDQPRTYCQLTATARLSFLPAGLARHTDLSAAGPRLEEIMERLAADFSCLLIDGGRTSDLAATALARHAAATYLVIQLGAVETSEAQAALRDFRAAGARILGCIAT